MSDLDPAAVAADMLKKALPGFESRIDGSTDSIAIRGALPVAMRASAETIRYPIRREFSLGDDYLVRAIRDVSETPAMRKLREAKERQRLEEDLAPSVGHIVETVQTFAIAAVGLEARMQAERIQAEERGRQRGYDLGIEKGRREGRAELLREWQEAIAGMHHAEG